MNNTISSPPHRGAQPYLFSYDITSNRRRRKVLGCLKRWRLDGQLSVHETMFRAVQVRELATELMELVDRDQDRLLSCRLSRRGDGPVYQLSGRPLPAPVLGSGLRAAGLPGQLHNGWYLLAYDIRDPDRLRRAQRHTANGALFLQRSVYLFQGSGRTLRTLLGQVTDVLDPQQDDLRVYALSGPADLWILSGPTPPLPGLPATADPATLWQRLRGWLGLQTVAANPT